MLGTNACRRRQMLEFGLLPSSCCLAEATRQKQDFGLLKSLSSSFLAPPGARAVSLTLDTWSWKQQAWEKRPQWWLTESSIPKLPFQLSREIGRQQEGGKWACCHWHLNPWNVFQKEWGEQNELGGGESGLCKKYQSNIDALAPGLNVAMVWMFVTPQNSSVEILSPKVMVLGGEAFGGWLGHLDGALMNWITALMKEASESSLALATL